MDIDCVCDVGSMDGSESIGFRQALPAAALFAFEANPENLRPMQANPVLREKDVQIVPMAAANYDGLAEFFIVQADYSAHNYQRGMSSLYKRGDGSALQATVSVPTTRLDSFFRQKGLRDLKLALWIDVEGKAYEVIEGAAGLMEQLRVLHVEVETSACIAPGQKLYGDVKAILESCGFVELACDNPPCMPQLNIVFVRRHLPGMLLLRVKLCCLFASAAFRLRRAARKIKHAVLRQRP